MTRSRLRFAAYLLASPQAIRREMEALPLERRELAPRWFNGADLAALTTAFWNHAVDLSARPPAVGATTLDDYESEFDSARGHFGTSWAWRFWDADTRTWGNAPTRRGLQQVDLAFWEEPGIGRDGRGSGSRAVRLFDHDADWLVVFSLETHQRLVLTAGTGVARINATIESVLGT